MWFLASFGFKGGTFGLVEAEDSLMASIGGGVAWIFAPLGFGTWQAVASSISGFVAKEGIVSTMGVLSGLGEIEIGYVFIGQSYSYLIIGNASQDFLRKFFTHIGISVSCMIRNGFRV